MIGLPWKELAFPQPIKLCGRAQRVSATQFALDAIFPTLAKAPNLIGTALLNALLTNGLFLPFGDTSTRTAKATRHTA